MPDVLRLFLITSFLKETGLGFGMDQRQRQRKLLHTYKFWAFNFRFEPGVSGLFQDLVQGSHFFRFFEEQAHRFL